MYFLSVFFILTDCGSVELIKHKREHQNLGSQKLSQWHWQVSASNNYLIDETSAIARLTTTLHTYPVNRFLLVSISRLRLQSQACHLVNLQPSTGKEILAEKTWLHLELGTSLVDSFITLLSIYNFWLSTLISTMMTWKIKCVELVGACWTWIAARASVTYTCHQNIKEESGIITSRVDLSITQP